MLGICAGLFVIGSLMPSAEPPPAPVAPNYADSVRIERATWRLGGFGAVLVGDVTIRNGNGFAVHDIALRCDVLAASGTELGRVRHTIYEYAAERTTTTFTDVNLGVVNPQAVTASCVVTGIGR